jgi:hypothetical protein
MMTLTRDQIFNLNDIQTKEIAVPEWGGSVLVRGLTGKERDQYEAAIFQVKGNRATFKPDFVRARLVAMSVVDTQGERVFSDGDVLGLSTKGAAALDRVFTVARRLSGLSERDISEMTKNSESDQGGDSPSA